MGMPLHVGWPEIAIRLLLTLIAGTAIGYDRGVRGRTAGLRTTILVGLAAAVAMIQVNLLLPIAGKPPSSFAVMDLMRLPLGILTGVGFIGGGAILRREGMAVGVTTAATLWIVTVLGLCFGGGQLWLGIVGSILTVLVLSGLKELERHMTRQREGTLKLRTESFAGDMETLRTAAARFQMSLVIVGFERSSDAPGQIVRIKIGWRSTEEDETWLGFGQELRGRLEILSLEAASV